MRRSSMILGISAVALTLAAVPFACKCPTHAEPESAAPPMARPIMQRKPKLLEPRRVREFDFKEKFRLAKQRSFLPPGAGSRPAAESQPAGAASQPAAALPEGAVAPAPPPNSVKAVPPNTVKASPTAETAP